MPGKEGPHFCDASDPVSNKEYYETIIFPEIFRVTDGAFTQADITGASRVVDFGMGRGAIGGFVRELNPTCELIGVDKETQYRGKTYYGLYDKKVSADLTDEDHWTKLKDLRDVNLILGVGLPPHVIEDLVQRRAQIQAILKQRGLCVLISDFPLKYLNPLPFVRYTTGTWLTTNLIYRNI